MHNQVLYHSIQILLYHLILDLSLTNVVNNKIISEEMINYIKNNLNTMSAIKKKKKIVVQVPNASSLNVYLIIIYLKMFINTYNTGIFII